MLDTRYYVASGEVSVAVGIHRCSLPAGQARTRASLFTERDEEEPEGGVSHQHESCDIKSWPHCRLRKETL